MMESALDEPEQIDDNDEEHLQHYDEAYARQYDNDHTWEQLQEDEHGNLRVVRPGSGAHPPPAPYLTLHECMEGECHTC